MIKKAGRPKKTKKDQRENILRIRLTASERHIIDVAAQKNHLDTSAWTRSIILKEAEKYKKS
jgi:uncharacterized protein (DUF1778 family)